ncbi:hypothetical protein [Vibrio owensii]|uniref:hypothetical protein n=1 Tax=Vibrio owensii TaxID=696485 RepID=UPI000597C501|nr:hypothetical protein [Vibrio owensii]
MGNGKGKNPFYKFQQNRIKERKKVLQVILADIDSKMVPKDVYTLIRHCAKMMGCNRTTLSRQPAYMNLIHARFATLNENVDAIDPDNATPEQMRKLICVQKAQINALKCDARRKSQYYSSEAYIKTLLSDYHVKKPEQEPNSLTKIEECRSFGVSKDELSRLQKDFESVCEVLHRLIKHYSEMGLELDKSTGALLDVGLGLKTYIHVNNNSSLANTRPFLKYLEKREEL